MVAGLAADVYADQFLQSLPPVKGLDSTAFDGDTIVQSRDDVLLADIGTNGDHRVIVPLSFINRKMIEATIAIEDKNFYSNQGFDPEGIARAAIHNYRAGTITGGGSTITQQLAKQQFLNPDKTVERKVKELVLAYQINQAYSKDQILELYLNKSFYGSQSYGVEAAARSYFKKDARDLTLAESAMLAGLPQAPTQYNPVIHPDEAKLRQREVLQAMVRSGFITLEDSEKAFAEPVVTYPPVNSFLAPHFVDYVVLELERLGFTLGKQQLRVKTTLDWQKQQIGQRVVRENVIEQAYRDPGGQLGSSLVSMDPRNGEIIVMVGSPEYNVHGGEINMTTRPVNPGSSVKVYTYSAALQARKATMDTVIYDGPSPYVWKTSYDKWEVYNYDKRSHGNCPLRRCIGNSLNIPAVKAELTVGVPAVVEFMRNVGVFPQVLYQRPDGSWYADNRAPLTDFGPALTLGGYAFTTLQHVTGEATIANMGVYHEPEAILSVSDARGKVIYQANPTRGQRQAMDPGVAFILSQVLSDDNNRCPILCGGILHFPERTLAVKTGTTDNFRDALTTGWTPRLATVLWIGDILDNSHTMQYGSDSSVVAAPAFHEYMTEVLRGVPDEWYQPPSNVVQRGNSWYLSDAINTVGKLSIDSLPSPSPTPITYDIPPNPGTGPILIRVTPSPVPSGTPSPDADRTRPR
jgi:membrane peptidoglycan carboxypeptidase